MRQDHDNAGDRHQKRRHLKGPYPLAGQIGGEADGEEDLDLDDERGQSGRDVAAHGDEEQAELPGADQHAVGRELAPGDSRALEKEHGRQKSKRKAQGGEEERRQVI